MRKFYSATTNGFYASEIHGDNMPNDVVEITQQRHDELFQGQSNGLRITSDENGYPINAPQIPPSHDEMCLVVRTERDLTLQLSDWVLLSDVPLSPEKKQEWLTYRQELRDVTSQNGFPFSVVWPVKPT